MAEANTRHNLFNEEAEELLIGAILNWPEAITEVRDKLTPEDFFTDLKYVYEAILKVGTKLADISEYIKKQGYSKEVGRVSSLTRLMENCPTLNCGLGWVDEIKRLSKLRKLASVGFQIQQLAQTTSDYETALNKAREMLDSLSTEKKIVPEFTDLRIQTSHPRRYFIKVIPPGQDLQVTFSQLISPRVMANLIAEHFDYYPIMPKKDEWENFVRKLLLDAEKESAPAEATIEGELKETIMELFDLRGDARSLLDIKTGAYAIKSIDGKEYYLFMPTAVLKWLKEHKKPVVTNADLWAWIKRWGGKKDVSVRLSKEESRRLWAVPIASIRQEENGEEEDEILKWL